MTDAAGAYAIIRARLEANAAIPLAWQNEEYVLPDTPAAFAYVEFLTAPAELASFGGGRGQNRYRNQAQIDIYVFVPSGDGAVSALEKAEALATIMRSYRDTDISCFEASVHPGGDGASLKPPGLDSEVGNYWWARVEVALFFDQIG